MSDIVLQAENISKYYQLGQFNNGTLFRDLQSWWAMKRGKADPNAAIGTVRSRKDGFWALKDINFSIRRGERVGIIGKNGAGKSTLLKLISEITAPTTGIIKVKGRVASLLEVGTGFHPEMTGRENIYLNGTILGMRKAEIKRKLDEIIDFSEIEAHIDTPVKRYSSGMYVKLAFAVAAHLDSDILIADEVLAVGDAAFQKKALGKMNDISRGQGRTVLFVSHNMGAVRGLCDTGILLDHGKLAKMGDLNEVIDLYFDNPFLNENETIAQKIKRLPGDESIEFRDITLYQRGKRIDKIAGNANSIDIEINVEIKKKESGLRVFFDLFDSAGVLLLRSYCDEQGGGISSVEPGAYICKAVIPANFLGGTKYIIVVQATVFNVRRCCGDGIKIPLEIIQDGIYDIAYPQEPLRGALGMALEWHTVRY